MEQFMKGFDSCRQNKIFKIINYILLRFNFGKIQIICSLIKHRFHCLRKTKLIIVCRHKNRIFITYNEDNYMNYSCSK